MGVPVTIIERYDPDMFDILGYSGGCGWNSINDIQTTKVYKDCKQHCPNGDIVNGSKINTGVTIKYNNIPTERYYTASNCDGYLVRVYGRVFIRKKTNTCN